MADARVDDAVEEVDDEIDRHHHDAEQQGATLEDRVVTPEDPLDEPFADAGPGKDRLCQDGAGEDDADLQPDHRDDRDESVAQRMGADHPARRQSLGACRADVVLAEHFEHCRARHPRDDGERLGSEHDHRQDEMRERRAEGAGIVRAPGIDEQEAGHRLDEVLHRDAPRDRRPPERDREQQDRQQAPPEDRHRVTGERHAHDAVVEDRVALDRGDDAGRQAEDDGEENGASGELDGRREERAELLDHRRVGNRRDAEIALQYGLYIYRVLQGDLGISAVTHAPVIKVFGALFPATIELSTCAILFAIVLGLPAGIVAAVKRNSIFDHGVMGVSLAGYSMPIFWWGLLAILLFSITLGWTPVSGRISVQYFIEPVTGFLLIDSWRADDA